MRQLLMFATLLVPMFLSLQSPAKANGIAYEYDWTIEKSIDPQTATIFVNQELEVKWTITVTPTKTPLQNPAGAVPKSINETIRVTDDAFLLDEWITAVEKIWTFQYLFSYAAPGFYSRTNTATAYLPDTGETKHASATLSITVLDAPAVPEPTSLILLGSGLGIMGLAAWRRRK